MPHPSRVRPALRLVLTVTLAGSVLAGCGGSGGDEPSGGATASGTTDASSSATPSGTPSASASADPTDGGSDQPSADPSDGPTSLSPDGPTLAGALLGAAQLPGFNDSFRWAPGRTSPEDPSRSFGTCQKFSTTAIGAERALVRRFRLPDGSGTGGTAAPRAGELVATFPDDLTARRAYAVLKAWRADCRQRLSRYARVRVGGLQDVPVTGGSASWYLLTYGPVAGDRDAAVLDAQGMTVVGSRIAMVSLVAVGQDYDYEPGQEPMVAALQRAAQKIG